MWWWLAAAFGVSWIADGAALYHSDPWLPVAIYPVSQAGIIVALLAARREAQALIGLLMLAGFVTILWEGVTGPTLFLDAIAAGVVVSVVWSQPKPLRALLLYAFGVGLLAWVGYTLSPGWLSWGLYQAVRAVSVGMFCWASERRMVPA